MYKALGYGARALADVDRQEQVGDGVHRHSHPVRRSRQALQGLGLRDHTVFDRTGQGKEFVHLHLIDVQVMQKVT